MSPPLDRGRYTVGEAARLTRLKPARVREWFKRQPLHNGVYRPHDKDFAISFYGLIDVFVAGRLMEVGLPPATVRAIYEQMGTGMNTPHPFCREELRTDGKIIFSRCASPGIKEKVDQALTKQNFFRAVLAPFLKTLDYEDSLARRWRIAPGVVIDPAICFGKPYVEKIGKPTYILAAAFHANGADALRVADFYGTAKEDVEIAARFESSLDT